MTFDVYGDQLEYTAVWFRKGLVVRQDMSSGLTGRNVTKVTRARVVSIPASRLS